MKFIEVHNDERILQIDDSTFNLILEKTENKEKGFILHQEYGLWNYGEGILFYSLPCFLERESIGKIEYRYQFNQKASNGYGLQVFAEDGHTVIYDSGNEYLKILDFISISDPFGINKDNFTKDFKDITLTYNQDIILAPLSVPIATKYTNKRKGRYVLDGFDFIDIPVWYADLEGRGIKIIPRGNDGFTLTQTKGNQEGIIVDDNSPTMTTTGGSINILVAEMPVI